MFSLILSLVPWGNPHFGGWVAGLHMYICPSVITSKNSHCFISVFSGEKKKKKVRKVGVCSLLNTRESTAASSIINTSRFKILEKLYTDIRLPEQIHMGWICDLRENSFQTVKTPGTSQWLHKGLNRWVWGLFSAWGWWDWREEGDCGLL